MLHILGNKKLHKRFWIGNLMERERTEDLHVDGRTTLKCILKKEKGGCGMDVSCSG